MLIVLTVLATLAQPLFRQHMLVASRSAAVASLGEISLRQSAHRAQHGRYAIALAALGIPPGRVAIDYRGMRVDPGDVASRYHLALAGDGSAYSLTATPVNQQVADTPCGVLTLNELGVAGVSGQGGTSVCWRVRS